jgi:hypothetical protein
MGAALNQWRVYVNVLYGLGPRALNYALFDTSDA